MRTEGGHAERTQVRERRVVALVGGRLLDGKGTDPLEDSVVILDGPVIQETGKKDRVKIPPDAEIIISAVWNSSTVLRVNSRS